MWWEDWELVKTLFKTFRQPNAYMPELRGSRNRRGKYARWCSLLLAASYAVQFRVPHLIILEDDSTWPEDLGALVKPHLRNDDTMVKLPKWGEGMNFIFDASYSIIASLYYNDYCHHII